jgi:hypothetical protein
MSDLEFWLFVLAGFSLGLGLYVLHLRLARLERLVRWDVPR